MSGRRLFGNNIEPACKYCMEGYPNRGETVLCPKRGIVPADYKCRLFYYDPLLRVPKRPLPLEKFDQASFSLEDL